MDDIVFEQDSDPWIPELQADIVARRTTGSVHFALT
jgi:hypothetical protein